MALYEYEVDGQTFLFDPKDKLLPKNAKRLDKVELATAPEPVVETVQVDGESVVPETANPEPVEESHEPKARKRRTPANKAAEPADDK